MKGKKSQNTVCGLAQLGHNSSVIQPRFLSFSKTYDQYQPSNQIKHAFGPGRMDDDRQLLLLKFKILFGNYVISWNTTTFEVHFEAYLGTR